MDTARTTNEPHQAPGAHHWSRTRTSVWLLAGILLILAGWALKALAVVVVPFVVALFIALAVAPLDRRIHRRMPKGLKWLGHAVAMTVVLVILVAFFAGVYLAAMQAVGQLPNVADELRAALAGPGEAGSTTAPATGPAAEALAAGHAEESGAAGLLGLGIGLGIDPNELVDMTAAYLAEHGTQYARAILSAAAGLLTGLAIVFFLALLMLVEGPTWRDKLANTGGRTSEADWEESFAIMARSFRRYFVVTALIGALTAFLYVGWLWLFGVGLLTVWFVLTFLLAFIPTVGSIIAGTLPIIYTLVARDIATALYVSAGIIAIEQVTGNYLSPRVLGKKLSISPVVTFFALLLFGWMWGIVGAILAVPLAVLIVIASAHVEPLRPVALILSDRADMRGLDEIASR